MSGFVLTPQAERDLAEIWDYVAADNVEAANRVVDRIEEMLVTLAHSSELGHFREDLADKRHRFQLVYSYLIVYRWETMPLQIIRILHAARDAESILDFGEN